MESRKTLAVSEESAETANRYQMSGDYGDVKSSEKQRSHGSEDLISSSGLDGFSAKMEPVRNARLHRQWFFCFILFYFILFYFIFKLI